MEPNTHRGVLCDFFVYRLINTEKFKILRMSSVNAKEHHGSLVQVVTIGCDSVSKDIVHQSRQRGGGVDWQVTSALFCAYLKS